MVKKGRADRGFAQTLLTRARVKLSFMFFFVQCTLWNLCFFLQIQNILSLEPGEENSPYKSLNLRVSIRFGCLFRCFPVPPCLTHAAIYIGCVMLVVHDRQQTFTSLQTCGFQGCDGADLFVFPSC